MNTLLSPAALLAKRRSLAGVIRWWTLSAFSLSFCGLLILNYGFQMIRVPPSGAGVPLMEILLLACVPFVFRLSILRQFSRTPLFAPLMLWFLWSGTSVVVSLPEHGLAAVRDGLPVLESIFLLLGFAMASQRDVMKSYITYLPYLVVAVVVYALLAPFKDQLTSISPTLPSTQGNPVPIFFTYTNTASLLVACSAYFWVRRAQNSGWRVWFPAMCIGIGLVLFPSRTFLLQVITMLPILSLSMTGDRFRALFSIVGMGLLVVFGIILLSYLGISIAGRLGVLSPEDYVRLIREIMIWETFEQGTTLSSGAGQRFGWWSQVIDRGLAGWTNFIFGIGYGEPLMDGVFHGGVITREPHNSWVSVFGRVGIVGLIIFTYLCFAIVRVTLAQVLLRAQSEHLGPFVVFSAVVVIGTLVLGLGESPFVMPFMAIPYYFLAGVLARMDSGRTIGRFHGSPQTI